MLVLKEKVYWRKFSKVASMHNNNSEMIIVFHYCNSQYGFDSNLFYAKSGLLYR
jgi:hypothetical protein